MSPLIAMLLVLHFCYTLAKLLASFEFYSDGSPVRGPTNATSSDHTHHTNSTYAYIHVHVQTYDDSALDSASGGGSDSTKHVLHPWLWGMLGLAVLSGLVYSFCYACLHYVDESRVTRKGVWLKGQRRRRYEVPIHDDEDSPLLRTVAAGRGEEGEGGGGEEGDGEGESSGDNAA